MKFFVNFINIIQNLIFSFFYKPLLNFLKKKTLFLAISSVFIDVDLLGNVEIGGPGYFHTEYAPFLSDDLIFLSGDLYIIWMISILLLLGAFNHTRKFHYVLSQYLIKIFAILLFFLSLIYFQFLSTFQEFYIDFKIILFNDMLMLDLNTLLFRFFSIIILFFCCIIFFNYTTKYFILPFEYLIIVLTSLFGMFWFISSLNFMVFFVGLEAQALSFYILSSIKKKLKCFCRIWVKIFCFRCNKFCICFIKYFLFLFTFWYLFFCRFKYNFFKSFRIFKWYASNQ